MGNVFGLGILLTLEDQASNRLTGFSNSLQNLSMRAMSLNYMGKSLINTGKAMLSPVIGLSKEIIRVNDSAEKARITLNALYKDPTGAKGMAKYAEIVGYAAKSPFEIEELRDASLQFKTLGVEILGAGSEVTATSGKTRAFMEILGDMGAGLSGVARNGFKDVTYAVREFVTEGNKLSFLRRLGVDIDAVLTKAGKTVGNTIEERLVNMADLAEILNFYDPETGEGLTSKMFGTWSQVISNMADLWDWFLLGVGDSDAGIATMDEFGNTVFGGFKRTLGRVQELMGGLNLYGFGQAIGKGLGSIMQPLDYVASKLVDILGSVMKFIGTHPEVAKYALLIPTIAGALFLVAGAALVAQGSMMIFGYGLGVIVGMLPKMLLMAGIFGAIYTAWTKDIGGIRTKLTQFASTVRTSMSRASEILNMETADMVKSYQQLVESWESTGNFGDGLTAKIIATKTLWGAFVQFWNNNKLSPETVKVLSDMGLLTTFEKIATWTTRIKEFCSGFVEGFSDMANAVTDFVGKIMGSLFPTMEGGGGTGLFNMLTGEFDGSGVDKAKGIGNFVAKVLPILWLTKKAFNLIGSIRGRNNRGGIAGLLGRLLGGDNATPEGGGGRSILGSLRRMGSTMAQLNPRQILRGLMNFGIIMGGLTVVALAIGAIASISPASLVLGGLAIAGLSVALLPISSPTFNTALDSISRMSRFKPKTFLKGIGNLAVILGSMTLLSMALGAVVGISPAAFIAGGLAITAMGALFTAVGSPLFTRAITSLRNIAQIKPTTILKGMANLGIIFGAMTALFMIVGAVSLIPFDVGRVAGITLVLAELGLVGLALSGFASLASKLKVSDVAIGAANMAIALGAMSAVFGLLAWISSFNFDVGRVSGIVDILMELGKVGTAITVMAGVIGAIEIMTGGIAVGAIAAGLGTIALVLAGMAGIMWLINKMTGNIDMGKLDTVTNMILKVGAIGTACTVLSAISGAMIAPALVGLVSIGLVVEGLAALSKQFARLESQSDKIQSGLNVMTQLGGGIGKAIGSFIGGIGEGVSNSLPKIGENISTFMDSIATIKTPQAGEQGIGDFLSSLADGLLKLTANDLLSIFTGGTDFAGTAEGLNQLAGAKTFFDFCSSYDASAFDNAKKFFQSLADISNIPNVGGIGQAFSGTNDFSGTATGLNQLAQTQPFFDFCGNLSATAFDNAKKFFQSLADISNIPNVGGIGQVFSGTNDFSGTTKGLNKLAESQTFFDFASNLTEKSFTNAKKLFETLSGIGEAFPNTGGVAQWFSGENDISGVGSKLKQFGTDTKDFFKSVSDLKVTNLNSVWDSVKKAGEVAGTDVSGLKNVGTGLKDFMTEAKSFFTEASTVDTSGVSNVATGLTEFFNVINTVVVTGLTNLSGSITSVVGSITSVNGQLLVMGASFVTVGTSAITAGALVVTGMTMMGTSAMSNSVLVVTAFTVMGAGVQLGASQVVTGMNMMVVAILTGSSLMVVAITSATSSCQGVLASFASSGYGYGASLVSNIAAGISANAGAIRSAIQRAVASAAGSVSINVPIKVGQNYNGTNNWVGGLTTINERGGELVDLPSGTRIYPHDKSVTMAFDEGMQTAMEGRRGGDDYSSHDDSVHFHAGAIVIQANGASEAEAERLANLVMEKIERKKRRKALATYQY